MPVSLCPQALFLLVKTTCYRLQPSTIFSESIMLVHLIENLNCARVESSKIVSLNRMSKAKEINSDQRSACGPFEVPRESSSPESSDTYAQSEQLLGATQPANHDALERRLECSHYEECLNLAAALDWESFTCAGCNGEIDESLLWRAGQSTKRDAVAKAICGAATRSALKGTAQK